MPEMEGNATVKGMREKRWASFLGDVPLVFMYLVFTLMSGERYRR